MNLASIPKRCSANGKKGWSYLSWEEFPHHCTDGPNCDIANIYYKSEIVRLLKKYDLVVENSKKYHFPIMKKFPKTELLLANYFGFFRFYWGVKS